MTLLELFQQDVTIHRDVQYMQGGQERHRLDIYAPPNAKELPVALWFYGGGWRSGDKRLFEHLGRALAIRGIITVAVNYRLTPAVQHPTHAEDCAAAVAWTYNNIASYGGNRECLFLTGHSAGAQIASLLALDTYYLQSAGVPVDVIRGVVPISGASDLAAHIGSTEITSREHIEEAFGTSQEQLRAASPLHHVKADAPPFLVVVAENDPQGLQDQGRSLADALRNVGVRARFISVKGRDHFSIVRRFGPGDDTTADAVGEFINYVAENR